MPIENSPNNELYQDTYNALKSLGFNHNEINKCLGKLIDKKNDFNTQDLIKESLKLLKNSR
jgi:Holliday junction resolvasome RuvABC DNA-binding subunit